MEGKIPSYVMKAAIKDQANALVVLRSLIPAFVKKNGQRIKENPVIE